ncbi:MAG: tyrosine-type recombinase/integrase [Candidatus Thorarchaeota archaeon]
MSKTKTKTKKRKRLHSDYKRFLEEQSVKDSTLNMMRSILRNFPPPRDLNAKWFRERTKKASAFTIKKEFGLARRVLTYLELENDLDKFKLPRREDAVTVGDLYTEKELNAIFKATIDTRDRALLKTLFESACRASEILSMTHENLAWEEDDLVVAIVSGKTGTREVYLKESVPALKRWIDVHPIGSGPVWVSLRAPHQAMSYGNLHHIVKIAVERAGLKRPKKKLVHMFRHTRITEFVKMGIRGQMLSKLVGWSKKSDMESVYVHLATSDVKNEVREKAFGMVKERPTKPLLTSTKCPRCGAENDNSSVVCDKCNMPLSDDAIVRGLSKDDRIAELEAKLDKMSELVWQLYDRAEWTEEEKAEAALPLSKKYLTKRKRSSDKGD